MNKLTNLELQFLVKLHDINNHFNLDKTDIDERYYDIILKDIMKHHDNNKRVAELLKLKHEVIEAFNSKILYNNFSGVEVASVDKLEEQTYKLLDQQNLMIDLILTNPGCYSKLVTHNIINKLKE